MYGTNSTSKNFEDLMTIASQNAAVAERKVSGLGNDGRNRRVDPKQVKLKEGVAKFLAKKDEEDRLKKDLEREKKEKLIQLRQQDRKATNRVRKMLSMTKSANKSCVEDAKDCLNASVAAQTQAGDFQPDEDDYGYTSNYADLMHKKMMEKYKSIPVKPAFPQERGVYVQKPQPLPRARRGNYETSDPSQYQSQEGSSPEQGSHEEPSSSKKQSKPKKPPPPDYQSLLALAQERQKEPAAPIKIVPEKMEKEEFEFGRPMTAKEKAAFLAEKELKERAARKHDLKSDRNNNSSTTSNDSKGERDKTPSFKIPRSRPREEEPAVAPKKPKVTEPEPYRPTKESQPQRKKTVEPTRNIENVPNSKLHSMLTKQNQPKQQQPLARSSSSSSSSSFGPVSKSLERPVMQPPSLPASTNPYKSKESQKVRPPPPPPPPQKAEQINKERKVHDKLELVREKPRYLSAFEGKEREKERAREESRKQQPVPKEVFKSKQGSSRDDSRERNKPRPSARMPQHSDYAHERKPAKRYEEPPQRRDVGRSPPQRRDVGGRSPPRMRGEPPRMKKPVRGRAVIDSDEDYDSEMDDFIDDSEADLGNISAEISRIFNYDRRRYMYEGSDEECMESSVAEQLREESRSLKIGIQEDKEDMAREEEEKRRKLFKMKKSGRY